jgi:hypothetical protein
MFGESCMGGGVPMRWAQAAYPGSQRGTVLEIDEADPPFCCKLQDIGEAGSFSVQRAFSKIANFQGASHSSAFLLASRCPAIASCEVNQSPFGTDGWDSWPPHIIVQKASGQASASWPHPQIAAQPAEG